MSVRTLSISSWAESRGQREWRSQQKKSEPPEGLHWGLPSREPAQQRPWDSGLSGQLWGGPSQLSGQIIPTSLGRLNYLTSRLALWPPSRNLNSSNHFWKQRQNQRANNQLWLHQDAPTSFLMPPFFPTWQSDQLLGEQTSKPTWKTIKPPSYRMVSGTQLWFTKTQSGVVAEAINPSTQETQREVESWWESVTLHILRPYLKKEKCTLLQHNFLNDCGHRQG